jgi:DNA-binding winged helix-turn-helix (wHTH) protein/tetratricopeptide (TPR) repeat protein
MNATTVRFGPCEIDEARRSLLANGQEVRVQPRVFDLLCYLIRHRDRVVSKDELLDALWPGTVVVDNALQRVVSLARSALAGAGLGDAVRTYPRHGYRFCLDDCDEAAPPPAAQTPDLRGVVEGGDWLAACEAYAAADAQSPLAPDDVEQWGRAAICAGLGPRAVSALERVVAQRDAAGDTLGAARATLLLVQIRIDHKQSALARGLLQRVSRYLDGQPACVERGHFAWMASRMAVGSGDADEALAMADEACSLGRSLREPDVECLGLVYRGHALMSQGRVTQGVAQHEEAAAVVRLGGVRGWVSGWALCSILYAARYRCDWLRAAQFAEAFVEWSALLGRAAPWAEGDAYCVLGEIRLVAGDFEGAEESFRHAHALGWDPQPGLARLHLLTGQAGLALRGLERALAETDWTLRERRGQILCLLVQAAVAAGEVERGRDALRTLATDPQMLATEALKAMHCSAEAELALADGSVELAAHRLRHAVRHWREIGSPVGEAETRLRLAECLLEDHDAAGAELELHVVESSLAAFLAPHRGRLQALRGAVRGAHDLSAR